jgi:hypothetical protein
LTACQKLNWDIEGENEYVLPKPMSANGPGEGERTFEKGTIVFIFFSIFALFTNKIVPKLNIVDMETLQQLSVYVANFEKKSFKVDLAANSSSVGPVGKKTGGY